MLGPGGKPQKKAGGKKSPLKRPAAATSTLVDKAAKKAKVVATRTHSKCNLPFPGKPKVGDEPLSWGNFRIYTDSQSQKYRVKENGVRTDRGSSWKVKGLRQAWQGVLYILTGLK